MKYSLPSFIDYIAVVNIIMRKTIEWLYNGNRLDKSSIRTGLHPPPPHPPPCSSVVRAFAHGAMGSRIDPSCGEPIELFLVLASAPRLV